MSNSRVQLTAYGTPADREKLKTLAVIYQKSESKIIVELIRREYEKFFGGDAQ